MGKKKPCKFWAEGTCRNGQACQFAHSGPSGQGHGGMAMGNTNNHFGVLAGGQGGSSIFGGGNSNNFSASPFGGQSNNGGGFGGGNGGVFGQNNSNVSSIFGQNTSNVSSVFGGNAGSASSFFGNNYSGSNSASNQNASSVFGVASGGGAGSNSGYGGNNNAGQSPFGGLFSNSSQPIVGGGNQNIFGPGHSGTSVFGGGNSGGSGVATQSPFAGNQTSYGGSNSFQSASAQPQGASPFAGLFAGVNNGGGGGSGGGNIGSGFPQGGSSSSSIFSNVGAGANLPPPTNGGAATSILNRLNNMSTTKPAAQPSALSIPLAAPPVGPAPAPIIPSQPLAPAAQPSAPSEFSFQNQAPLPPLPMSINHPNKTEKERSEATRSDWHEIIQSGLLTWPYSSYGYHALAPTLLYADMSFEEMRYSEQEMMALGKHDEFARFLETQKGNITEMWGKIAENTDAFVIKKFKAHPELFQQRPEFKVDKVSNASPSRPAASSTSAHSSQSSQSSQSSSSLLAAPGPVGAAAPSAEVVRTTRPAPVLSRELKHSQRDLQSFAANAFDLGRIPELAPTDQHIG